MSHLQCSEHYPWYCTCFYCCVFQAEIFFLFTLEPEYSAFGPESFPKFVDFGTKLDFEPSPTQEPRNWAHLALTEPPTKNRAQNDEVRNWAHQPLRTNNQELCIFLKNLTLPPLTEPLTKNRAQNNEVRNRAQKAITEHPTQYQINGVRNGAQ